MDKIKFGVVGCGSRGKMLTKVIAGIEDIEIISICDSFIDRAEEVADVVEEKYGGRRPAVTTDYKEMFDSGIDAFLNATAWEAHISLALEAMDRGIVCALEVGGAYTVEDCFKLVEKYEETKTPIMLMENCCYNKQELLVTAMARDGLFGEIVHCQGAYGHDLRGQVVRGEEKRHYRLRNYVNRNCENYPTHELGPIAKLLNINRGNKMDSLVCMASKEAGLTQYIENYKDHPEKPVNPNIIGQKFAQGDIVTTLIKCANGETITLRLDTSLPRHYNREFTVHGTKGLYEMGCHMVFFDGMKEEFDNEKFYREHIGNAAEYEEKYLPEVWKNITPEQIENGHGGMDEVIFRDFARRLIEGRELPIDVYDTAAWMVITALTEKSIKEGGAVQEIPDFTHGMWKTREPMDVIDL